MKSVILGGTAGLGRALATKLSNQGHDLVLISQDERDLAAIKNDLEITNRVKVEFLKVNLAAPLISEAELSSTFKDTDNLFLISGYLDPYEDNMKMNSERTEHYINVNYTRPTQIMQLFLQNCPQDRSINLVGIGTVACIRPRPRNAL